MVRILLLNLLDDTFHLLRLAIIDSQIVLIVLQCSAHAVQRLSNLSLLVGDQGLSEKTLSAGVIVATKLFAEPIQNDIQVFLGLVVQDQWDLNLVVLGNCQVILNDEVAPDLNNFLEESFRVDKLSRLLEQLAHVEVARANVDAFWSILDALLVDTASQLVKGLLVGVGSILCHKETAEGDIQRCSEALKLLSRHSRVLSTRTSIITTTTLSTL